MDYKSIQQAIDSEIKRLSFGETPAELYEPLKYIMNLGGKRLRPVLCILAYNLYKKDIATILKPAVAVEVFHNFTLLHDDLMDQAPTRRGQPTVHEHWNANIAILSGDVMLVKAYELFFGVKNDILLSVFQNFSRTAAEVCEGQQLDMNFESKSDVSKSDYLNMIRLKTSVLLGFAMKLGGILAEISPEEQNKLYDIGVNAGLGFQLMDDILDVYGNPEKFGKQVGGDILANKKTWLLLDAIENSKDQSKTELNFWLKAESFDPNEKVAAITNIYNLLNTKSNAEELANNYFQKALVGIEQLDCDIEAKMSLIKFFEGLMQRES